MVECQIITSKNEGTKTHKMSPISTTIHLKLIPAIVQCTFCEILFDGRRNKIIAKTRGYYFNNKLVNNLKGVLGRMSNVG